MKIFQLLALLCFVTLVAGHGYMNKPAMRGSMWRLPGRYPEMSSPQNVHDNALRAGGPFYIRRNEPERKYGVCGDAFTDATPRDHETGGVFGRFPTLAQKAISECYAPGGEIDIEIYITANHGGIFQYELCVPGLGNDESEDCFKNGYLLEKSDGSGTDFILPSTGGGRFSIRYKVPNGVTCDNGARCIIRWYWLTGNNAAGGEGLLEEYWNCADIQISFNCGNQEEPSPSLSPSPTPSSATVVAVPTASISPNPNCCGEETRSPSPFSPSPEASPSISPIAQGSCTCNEGYCPTGTCDNCLLIYGPNLSSRLCYVGFSKSQCNPAQNSGYVWCGSN